MAGQLLQSRYILSFPRVWTSTAIIVFFSTKRLLSQGQLFYSPAAV